ncbi:cytochrome P450 [Rhizophagus irregularis]|uniref:Cytochrome P450 n=1 Tax=Rhizophagus irregularis TaxID=588596 RepID=A0A2N0R518_9GLOM|nr:cytochrome P450 [Rhizophagus irregularis]GET66308.1 cytochrome P450 [Rhizophagus irregularis DAOM 181602=DAOM 197198]
MTDLEIRVIIFDGIIAGNDTTANTISFIIYYLANYPDVKTKMLNEIDRIFKMTRHEAINGKTIIRINIDGIHNNEEYWEEPNKFYPDKWMIEG